MTDAGPRGLVGRGSRICAALVLLTGGHGACAEAAQHGEARRPGDIGRAFLACWHPPAGGGEVTLSLALRRDGSVIDVPRVVYVRSGAGRDDADSLKATIVDAVRACTPIPIALPLRAYIAGQVLRIRFVADPGGDTKRARVTWTGT